MGARRRRRAANWARIRRATRCARVLGTWEMKIGMERSSAVQSARRIYAASVRYSTHRLTGVYVSARRIKCTPRSLTYTHARSRSWRTGDKEDESDDDDDAAAAAAATAAFAALDRQPSAFFP